MRPSFLCVCCSQSTATAAAPLVRSRLAAGLFAGAALSTAVAYNVAPVSCAGKIPIEGIPGTNTERTFIAIKPDGVQRALVGKIIQRFEEKVRASRDSLRYAS